MPLPAGQLAAMGFYFYPRGGSAQVARYLSRSLAGGRWAPTLFAGSLGGAAQACNARHFFGGVRCEPLDYTPAADAWSAGCDPMAMAVPMHASYESKAGVPDRVFGDLDDRAYDLQVASWVGFLSERAVGVPSVVHLHHLTPMHAAVRRVWPRVPLITHLHGTELKMLAAIRDDPLDLECGRYGVAWATRMQSWAGRSDRVVVVSATDHALALDLLPLDPGRVVTIASGVDTDVFEPKVRAWSERLALWRRWLVDDPRGWRPGGAEGSIRYTAHDLSAFTDDAGRPVPVVLFAGRFLRFKRLQLLIEAHHTMRSLAGNRSVLVIVGGFPGEWEGEHPYDTVHRLGAQGVFFVGWRDHVDLAEILGCSDGSPHPLSTNRSVWSTWRRCRPACHRSPPTPGVRSRSSTSTLYALPAGWCRPTTWRRRRGRSPRRCRIRWREPRGGVVLRVSCAGGSRGHRRQRRSRSCTARWSTNPSAGGALSVRGPPAASHRTRWCRARRRAAGAPPAGRRGSRTTAGCGCLRDPMPLGSAGTAPPVPSPGRRH